MEDVNKHSIEVSSAADTTFEDNKVDYVAHADLPSSLEASAEGLLVNTDSLEEYNQDLDDLYNSTLQKSSRFNSSDDICLKVDEDLNCEGTTKLLSSLKVISANSPERDTQETFDCELLDEEEYLHNASWLNKQKHIFILSESGKPVYSRYGKEDRIVTLFGLTQALVSFVADCDDVIRSITAGRFKFVFLVRSPLILAAVCQSAASISQLTIQLSYVHSQVVSVLTASALTRMFEKRRNYDFRNLLGGTERLLDNLLDDLDRQPCFFLGAIQCLPMVASVREAITQIIIQNCSKIKDLVFALLIFQNQLISLVRMKKYLLHPADLHLVFNLITATESLKSSENWMPVCLPKFDPKGYLYGHVSYLADDCEACLILLSVDREQFFTLSEAKQKIVEKFRRNHYFEKINQAIRAPSYDVTSVGAPELTHFLYKSKSTAQFTYPQYSIPYNIKERQIRLFGLYQLLHHRIHSVSRPLKMLYFVNTTETMVGWVTKEFELYAVMDPLMCHSNAVTAVNKLLQWIKSEETKLFILSTSTF